MLVCRLGVSMTKDSKLWAISCFRCLAVLLDSLPWRGRRAEQSAVWGLKKKQGGKANVKATQARKERDVYRVAEEAGAQGEKVELRGRCNVL